MIEKLNDWNIDPDPETLAFHLRQAEPYRSTVHFASFARPWLATSNHIIDLGCGAGQATGYLAEQFPQAEFLGIDVSPKLVELARQQAPTASFITGDMHSLMHRSADGVISLATLSWMPGFEEPLHQITEKIHPKWMAFSALIYHGDISAQIVVDEPKRPRKSYYNIYSAKQIQKFLMASGYYLKKAEPFVIDIDLPKPADDDLMKSYTCGKAIFSGPLYLPWAFMLFARDE